MRPADSEFGPDACRALGAAALDAVADVVGDLRRDEAAVLAKAPPHTRTGAVLVAGASANEGQSLDHWCPPRPVEEFESWGFAGALDSWWAADDSGL